MSDAQAAQGTPVADTSTRNIAEAVDGKGQSAKLIRAEPKGEKGKPGAKPAPEAKAKPAEVTPPTTETPQNFGFDQIEQFLRPSEEPPAEDDLDIDEDPETEGKPEGRFNKTVRHLRKRAQAAEQQFATLQTELQKRDHMMSLMQKDLEHQRESQRSWEQRFQQAQAPKSPDEMPLDPNDPEYAVKKFRREVLADAEARLSTKFDPYKQEIEGLKTELQKRDEAVAAARTRQQYNFYSDKAASELTKEFAPEYAGRLNKALGQFILTAAYSWKTDPRTAAKVLDRVMSDYGIAKLKARMAASKSTAANANSPTPPPLGRGAPNAHGTAIPTRADARKEGFRDELEAMFARDGLIST